MDLATQRYLSSLTTPQPKEQPRPQKESPLDQQNESAFLNLPIELRRMVYARLLPTAKPSKPINSDNVVWSRGSVAFLRANQQVNAEASEMLYSSNIFIVDVRHGGISLRTQWAGKFQDYRSSSRPFLETITRRNLGFMRYLVVNVQHVDSYTGMIKYNTQGPGLTHSLRVQVKKLVDALMEVHSLRRIRIHLSVWSETKRAMQIGQQSHTYIRPPNSIETATEDLADPQTALEPFGNLKGIPDGVEVDGDIDQSIGAYLNRVTRDPRSLMETTKAELGFLDLNVDNPVIVKRKW